ncbi:MAG: hypothetical protein ABI784_04155 [Ginsengibacter sp.]
MKKLLVTSTSFLFLILCTSLQTLSLASPNADPIKKVVKEIAKANIYEYTTIYKKDGVLTEQMIQYKILQQLASPERLISIIKKEKNAVVRLYAYMALVSSLKSVPPDILERMNNDQTEVRTSHENISGSETVATIAKTFLY